MNDKMICALGFFDGVHLGHSALLAACRELAHAAGCSAGVITFSSHPDALVSRQAPPLINTLSDRDRLLTEQFHMDKVISLPFDREMMNTSWEQFYETIRQQFHVAGIVCGADFRFGRQGSGCADTLKARCARDGLPCVVVPQQMRGGRVVSSTRIRELIAAGDMEQAVALLGHPHILSGRVVRGQQLGRTLGIPTANMLLPEGLVVPKFGVYACQAVVDGARYPAVTNIGTRPTVSGQGITVEPWILDFQAELYGREIRLEFYKFLRSERKFPNLQELKVEILDNARQTRLLFEKLGHEFAPAQSERRTHL